MRELVSNTNRDSPELRVLFCVGVLPDFYAQPAARFERLMEPFFQAFDRLGERFGIRVLGTLDVDVDRLWRYAKIEARVGPPLDFGNG